LVLPVVSVLTGRLNFRHTLKGVTQFFPNSMRILMMRNTVIHIPTKSGSDNVQGLIVVLIFCQLSSGCILKHRGDDVCILYDLPNGTILAQEIVVILVFPITEILTIEYIELYKTFLHVAFGSQSLLKTTSNLTGFDTN
jgi:hypothetical protein